MPPLDPADLTKRQRRVYRGMQAGLGDAEMARRFSMGRGNVRSAIDQIKELERRGRRSVLEATARAAEIDARLAAQPVCPYDGLRGDHICTRVAIIAAAGARTRGGVVWP